MGGIGILVEKGKLQSRLLPPSPLGPSREAAFLLAGAHPAAQLEWDLETRPDPATKFDELNVPS